MKNWEQNENNHNILSYNIMDTEFDRPYTIYCKVNKKGNISNICFVDRFGLRYDFKVSEKSTRQEKETDDAYATRIAWQFIYKIPTEEELGIVTVAEQEEINKEKDKKTNFKNIEDKENTVYTFLNDKTDPKNPVALKPSALYTYAGKGVVLGPKNLNKGKTDEKGNPLPKNFVGNKILKVLSDNPEMINKIAGHDLKDYYKKRTEKNASELFYNKFSKTAVNKVIGNTPFFVEYEFDEEKRPKKFKITYHDEIKKADVVKEGEMKYHNFFQSLREVGSLKSTYNKNEKTQKREYLTIREVKNLLAEDTKNNKPNSYYKNFVFRAILDKNGISFDKLKKDGKDMSGMKFHKLAEVTFEDCINYFINARIEDTMVNYIKSKAKLPKDQFKLFVVDALGTDSPLKAIEKFITVENIETVKEVLEPDKEEVKTDEKVATEKIEEPVKVEPVKTEQVVTEKPVREEVAAEKEPVKEIPQVINKEEATTQTVEPSVPVKVPENNQEIKEEKVPANPINNTKETKNQEIVFENASSEKLYKVLTAIARKLDNALSVVNNFRKQLLNGKTFNPKKVLETVASNINDAFNFAEIKEVKKEDNKEDFTKIFNQKIDDLSAIINNQNEIIAKQNEMIAKQNETIEKQNEMMTALYSNVAIDKLDTIKAEMNEIDAKYKKSDEIINFNDDKLI